MEFLEQVITDKDKVICKFWIDEDGDVDPENLPHAKELCQLFRIMRLRNVEIEFTGRIIDE